MDINSLFKKPYDDYALYTQEELKFFKSYKVQDRFDSGHGIIILILYGFYDTATVNRYLAREKIDSERLYQEKFEKIIGELIRADFVVDRQNYKNLVTPYNTVAVSKLIKEHKNHNVYSFISNEDHIICQLIEGYDTKYKKFGFTLVFHELEHLKHTDIDEREVNKSIDDYHKIKKILTS